MFNDPKVIDLWSQSCRLNRERHETVAARMYSYEQKPAEETCQNVQALQPMVAAALSVKV